MYYSLYMNIAGLGNLGLSKDIQRYGVYLIFFRLMHYLYLQGEEYGLIELAIQDAFSNEGCSIEIKCQEMVSPLFLCTAVICLPQISNY